MSVESCLPFVTEDAQLRKCLAHPTPLLAVGLISVAFAAQASRGVAQVEEHIGDTKKNLGLEKAEGVEAQSGFAWEMLDIEQQAYSSGEDVTLGQIGKIETAVRYTLPSGSFARVRGVFEAETETETQSTSELEFLVNGRWQQLVLQADAEINFDKEPRGSTDVSLDQDSALTYLRYYVSDRCQWSLYPFNFGGEVGYRLHSGDVTRIVYIEGFPDQLEASPLDGELVNGQTRTRTLGGLDMSVRPSAHVFLSMGVAAGRYYYPEDEGFSYTDIQQNPIQSWAARTDVGYRLRASWSSAPGLSPWTPIYRPQAGEESFWLVEGGFVGHKRSEQGGSLLASSASLYVKAGFGAFRLEWESGLSVAGKAPLRLNNQQTGLFLSPALVQLPVFSDFDGEKQEWVGKTGYAQDIQATYQLGDWFPYVGVRYTGPHYVWDDPDSSHRLRTVRDKQGHGGLTALRVGLYWDYQGFVLQPELRMKYAERAVFDRTEGRRNLREIEELQKTETSAFVKLSYTPVEPLPFF